MPYTLESSAYIPPIPVLLHLACSQLPLLSKLTSQDLQQRLSFLAIPHQVDARAWRHCQQGWALSLYVYNTKRMIWPYNECQIQQQHMCRRMVHQFWAQWKGIKPGEIMTARSFKHYMLVQHALHTIPIFWMPATCIECLMWSCIWCKMEDNVWQPVIFMSSSQWRARIALFASWLNNGSWSRKSSMIRLQSMYACQSRRDYTTSDMSIIFLKKLSICDWFGWLSQVKQ